MGIAVNGGPDAALSAEVGGDRLGPLLVFAHHRQVVAAREHAAPEAPCHVAGADQRDVHDVSPLSLRVRASVRRLGGGWTSS